MNVFQKKKKPVNTSYPRWLGFVGGGPPPAELRRRMLGASVDACSEPLR